MFERGLFEKGIAALKEMKTIGDAGSLFSSDLLISVAYMKQYFITNSLSFAQKARNTALSGLRNKNGLRKNSV